MVSNSRQNNISIVHIIAALMVMLGHEFALLQLPAPVILGMDVHGLGVRILFVISGYLVSGSYLRTKRINYLAKRIERLLPPLAICLVITILGLYPFSTSKEYYWNSAKDYFLYNIRMYPKFDLAGVFTNNPYPFAVNGSLWTIPIELFCYIIIIPIIDLFSCIKRKNNKAAKFILFFLLLGLSFVDIYYTITFPELQIVFYGTDWLRAVNLMIWFFIGVSFHLLDLKRFIYGQIAVILTLLFSLSSGIIRTIITPYIISYDVLCFALAKEPIFFKTVKRDICYGIYLYAFPVQQLLIHLFPEQVNKSHSTYIFFIVSVVITWIIAEANYKLVEIPFDRLFKRINNKLK